MATPGGLQSSPAGRPSPINVPVNAPVEPPLAMIPRGSPLTRVALLVFPAIKLRTPGVDGPKVDPKELSLMREVLRVIPKGRDGIAVVIAHYHAAAAAIFGAGWWPSGGLEGSGQTGEIPGTYPSVHRRTPSAQRYRRGFDHTSRPARDPDETAVSNSDSG